MKKSKFLKALLALVIAVASAVSVFGMAACNPDDGKVSVSEVKVSSLHGERTLYEGKDLQFVASVSGKNNPAQTVTWESSDPTKATITEDGLVTGVDAGSVTIIATSTVDNTKSGSYDLTIKEIPGVPSNETDRAVVPAYSGPAAGPSSDPQDITYKLDPMSISTSAAETAIEEAWTDGIFSIPQGTVLRGKTPKDENNTSLNQYKESIKNGVITVNVPSAGKLKFYFANGSGTAGKTKYKITSLGVVGDEVTVPTGSGILTTVEIDVVQGEYQFKETGGGTIDMYLVELTLTDVDPAPIVSLTVTKAGTTDYLVTQKVDCTGVQLVTKDGNGITQAVDLANCQFDTSKYNPNLSGEYEIGITYTLSQNLTSETKEFKATYTVKVYEVDSIELDLVGLSGKNQVTVQQAYLTTDTYAKDNYISVMATCDFNGEKIVKKIKSDWYSITESLDLTTAGKKTVTVSVDDKYTVGNKPVEASYEVISAAKKAVKDGKVTVTVGKKGEFSTVTQAVQYLKKCKYQGSVVKVIEIEPGTYAEKVWIDVPNVALVGKGKNADDTVITCSLVEGDADNYSGAVWGLSCATVHVTGANFKAYNVAIRNDFDYIANSGNYSGTQAAQGVALTLDADGAVIYNCHLYGNQDTLYMQSGRSYYYKTQIDGNIDFIFGGENGLGFFEECKIVAISRNNTKQNGYVTAAKHSASKKPNYGYIFYKCELTDDGKVTEGTMSLGRPWGEKATVAYIKCSFSKAYSTVAYGTANANTTRWSAMSGALPANADFCEFGSTGAGAISSAVAGGSILTETASANYTKDNIFGTSNGNVGYTTVFDCAAEYSKLRIVAGLDKGPLPKETTITVDLTDTTIPNGNCLTAVNEMYSDVLTWTGAASFETAKPTNGVKIAAGTVIKINIVGEVKLVAGYELPASDYTITYKDGKATITFTAATGTYGTYIGSIVIDTTKTPANT